MKIKRQSRRLMSSLVHQTLNDTLSSFRHFRAFKNSSQRSLNQALSAKKHLRDAVNASRRLSPPKLDLLAYTHNDPFGKSVCKRRKERRQVLFAKANALGTKRIQKKNPPRFTEESYYVRCK